MTVPILLAEVTYPTNGTVGPFAVPFSYLDKSYVKVYVDEVATVLFTWPTPSTIQFNSIPVGSYILFRRETPTSPLVVVPAGSINPDDINKIANQSANLAQEMLDQIAHMPRLSGDPLAALSALTSHSRASLVWANDSSGNTTLISLAGLATVANSTSLEVFLSKSVDLPSADAAAALLGAVLVIDKNYSLTGNTTLASKAVHFRGGVITRGAFNLIINGSVTAPDCAIFDKAGAGTITISQGGANFAWFGCSRDGVTDDTAPLNRALASCKSLTLTFGTYAFSGTILIALAGASIQGLGVSSSLKGLAGTGKTNVTASNVSLRNFTYTGSSSGEFGFNLGPSGAVATIVVEDVTFTGGIQYCVWLHTCSQVWVNRCRFTHIAFGVLQEQGYSCNSIKVTNCIASDMLADFVEMNGDGGGTGYDLLVEGNSFLGANNWTAPQIIMFVGLTNFSDAKIVNNYVQNVAGDGAVHLEDIGGRITIQGNTFVDCNVSGGNNGWIYLLNTAKIVTIQGNWFIKTGALTTACAAISTGSGIYGNSLTISGNYFIGVGTNFTAIDLTYHQGYGLVDANYVAGCAVFLTCASGTTKRISNNYVLSTPMGILCQPGVSQSAGTDFEVSNNTLTCSTYSILVQSNSGTTRPQRWTVQGNKCGGKVRIDDGIDCFGMGNTYVAGLSEMSVAINAFIAPTRCVDKNDFQIGTGLIHP